MEIAVKLQSTHHHCVNSANSSAVHISDGDARIHQKPGSCGPCPFVEAHARTCFRAEQQNTERAQRAALAEANGDDG